MGSLARALAYALLVGVAIAMFVPFLWSLSTSLKSNQKAALFPPTILPQHPTLAAYERVLTAAPFFRWFANSTLVVAGVVATRGVFASMAGYAFARLRSPGGDAPFLLVLGTLMVPATVLFVPRYIVVLNLHLVDTLHAMWIPFMVDAFGVFLMQQFFLSIPIELEEAARIDGAGRMRLRALGTSFGSYTGVDFTEAMLARARAKLGTEPRVHFERRDLMADPLPEGPSDLVVSTYVFEHLPDPIGVAERARAQARSGGHVLLLFETQPSGAMGWLQRLLLAAFSARRSRGRR